MQSVIDFISNLLFGEGIIIAAAVFAVAEIIKKSLDFIPKKLLPLIGGLLGIILALIIPNVFPGDTLQICAIKGLVLGWAATGAFETLKNASK